MSLQYAPCNEEGTDVSDYTEEEIDMLEYMDENEKRDHNWLMDFGLDEPMEESPYFIRSSRPGFDCEADWLLENRVAVKKQRMEKKILKDKSLLHVENKKKLEYQKQEISDCRAGTDSDNYLEVNNKFLKSVGAYRQTLKEIKTYQNENSGQATLDRDWSNFENGYLKNLQIMIYENRRKLRTYYYEKLQNEIRSIRIFFEQTDETTRGHDIIITQMISKRKETKEKQDDTVFLKDIENFFTGIHKTYKDMEVIALTIDKKITGIRIQGETQDQSRNKVLDDKFQKILHELSQRKYRANLDYCKVHHAVLELSSDQFFSYKISYSELIIAKLKHKHEEDQEDEAWEKIEKIYCNYLCAVETMHMQKDSVPRDKKPKKDLVKEITQNLKNIYKIEKLMTHKVKTSASAWRREDAYLGVLNKR